jgi:hypothetical protein
MYCGSSRGEVCLHYRRMRCIRFDGADSGYPIRDLMKTRCAGPFRKARAREINRVSVQALIKSSAESPKLGEQRMIMIEHVSITNVRMPTPLRNPVTNGEERNFFSVLRRPTLRVSWRLLRWQDVSELPRARCAVGGQLDPRVRRSVASMFASTKIRRSTMR